VINTMLIEIMMEIIQESSQNLPIIEFDPLTDMDIKETCELSLTENKSSHVEISFVPKELMEYGVKHFDELFALHPNERHRIISKTGEDYEVFRWQMSYLKTPDYNASEEYFKTHNYMYSGLDTSKNNDDLPNLFAPFYEFAKKQDDRYNQVVINWYDANNDYIAFHRDCQRKMLKDVPIMVITLSEQQCRDFEIIPFEKNDSSVKPNYSNVKIASRNGSVIKMCGEFQTEFRHGIRQNSTNDLGRRISISFRSFE
jgi:alkylated DNA repair dioxygenase AlkB